jgi:hypothetical protein
MKNMSEKMMIRVNISATESLKLIHDHCMDSSKSVTWDNKKTGTKKSSKWNT